MAARIAFAVHVSAPVQALLGEPADVASYLRGAFATVISMAARAGGSVGLAAENVAWQAAPVAVLREAVEAGGLKLLATHAHNAHAAYLTPDEAEGEVRANCAAVTTLFGGVAPEIVMPPGLGYDPAFAGAYRAAGVHAVIVPSEGPVRLRGGLHAIAAPARWLEAWEFAQAAGDAALWESVVMTGTGVQAVFLRGGDGAAAWLDKVSPAGPAHWPLEETGDLPAGEGCLSPLPVRVPLVRWDGMYPPPGTTVAAASADEPARLYARHPFILYEAGLPLVRLLKGVGGAFPETPEGDEVLILLRKIANADLWGPVWSLQGQRAAGILCSRLAQALRQRQNAGLRPGEPRALDPSLALALRASLAFFLDNPLNAAERAVREQGDEPGVPVAAIREHRLRAAEGLMRLEQALGVLKRTPGAWYHVVDMLDLFGREWATAAGLFHEWAALRGGLPEARASVMASVYPPQLAVLLERFFTTGRARAPQFMEDLYADDHP